MLMPKTLWTSIYHSFMLLFGWRSLGWLQTQVLSFLWSRNFCYLSFSKNIKERKNILKIIILSYLVYNEKKKIKYNYN